MRKRTKETIEYLEKQLDIAIRRIDVLEFYRKCPEGYRITITLSGLCVEYVKTHRDAFTGFCWETLERSSSIKVPMYISDFSVKEKLIANSDEFIIFSIHHKCSELCFSKRYLLVKETGALFEYKDNNYNEET